MSECGNAPHSTEVSAPHKGLTLQSLQLVFMGDKFALTPNIQQQIKCLLLICNPPHHPAVLPEENCLAQKRFGADATDVLSEMKDMQCLLLRPTEDSIHFSKMWWSHSITSPIQHQQEVLRLSKPL